MIELLIESTSETHEVLLDSFNFNVFTWNDKKIKDAVFRESKKFGKKWSKIHSELNSQKIKSKEGIIFRNSSFYNTQKGIFFSFVTIKCRIPISYTFTFKKGNWVFQHKISGLMFIHADADTLVDVIKMCIEKLNREAKL